MRVSDHRFQTCVNYNQWINNTNQFVTCKNQNSSNECKLLQLNKDGTLFSIEIVKKRNEIASGFYNLSCTASNKEGTKVDVIIHFLVALDQSSRHGETVIFSLVGVMALAIIALFILQRWKRRVRTFH